jgi:hypothetical protein
MKQTKVMKPPSRLGRLALVGAGIFSLLCGIWGGLVRLPLNLPLPSNNANWITFHGPLMVCGFLGTVITLERAVGLRSLWTYAAPALTGTGALLLASGQLGRPPLLLIAAGSAVFVAVTCRVVQLQRALFTSVMALAALAWLVGNWLWLSGWSINRIVPWWIGFLALTIVGERLDLSRFQKPSRWSPPLLYLALGAFIGGLILSAFAPVLGERVVGGGLLALAAWLMRFDIARRTVRQPGLPRFMAVCLLVGYIWLAVAGALMLEFSPLESGLRYDAALHTFFLGFVFSMIFGHAPVIFPAVLNVQPCFRRRFYAHLLLLHTALMLRVTADLTVWPQGREWGAEGTALAILLFLGNTVSGFICQRAPAGVSLAKRQGAAGTRAGIGH